MSTVLQLLYSKSRHVGVLVRVGASDVVVFNRHPLVAARSRNSSAVGEAALIRTLQVRILRPNRIRLQSRSVIVVFIY